jgi:hypothetical protein
MRIIIVDLTNHELEGIRLIDFLAVGEDTPVSMLMEIETNTRFPIRNFPTIWN